MLLTTGTRSVAVISKAPPRRLNWMGRGVSSQTTSPYAPHIDMKISWLPTIAGTAVLGTVIRAVFFTPLEAKQGAAQKIFYIHVPAAWVAFLAFGLVAIARGLFLWLRDPRLEPLCESFAGV